MVMVFARPPQIHCSPVAGRAGSGGLAAVGAHQRAVEVHVGVPGRLRGQQRAVQTRRCGGEHIDALMQIPVGRGPADVVADSELSDAGGVEEPAQDQHRVPPRAQRTAAAAGTALPLVIGQQPDQVDGGVLPDRELAGVGDRIGHAGPRYRVDLWSDRLLYRGPHLHPDHPGVLGVSPPKIIPLLRTPQLVVYLACCDSFRRGRLTIGHLPQSRAVLRHG